jgi:catechol 2,3-dioxygenase-like lactoylglutathione lyase family enzyme
MFSVHHGTLSVADLDRSIAFYSHFGFDPVTRWAAEDGSLGIVHLSLGGIILELFCFAANSCKVSGPYGVGNDLEQIGVKHLALRVPSLHAAKALLADLEMPTGTEIIHGRTGIDYFFVQDPDGLWLEIVEDHRSW